MSETKERLDNVESEVADLQNEVRELRELLVGEQDHSEKVDARIRRLEARAES